MNKSEFSNPFRPGAGHMPPYLAGRKREKEEFIRLLGQDTILENLVLTGLRGVGKTVLLDTLKPMGIQHQWLWVGTDLSESSSISEENMALRLITDLSVVTSGTVFHSGDTKSIGFNSKTVRMEQRLDFNTLCAFYQSTPGLVADKLKAVLEFTWSQLQRQSKRGLIFAYDEAQNLGDYAEREQFPLSLLLDLFQSIQKKNIPFMLVLVGLPTLFPQLVEARTFAERMFRVVFLDRLSDAESKEAILRPIKESGCPLTLKDEAIDQIIELSAGYPYFIQFICRDLYDVALQKLAANEEPVVPVEEITRKLDTDFFAGRWAKVTDRQRDLLHVIAQLGGADSEFTVQEIVQQSRETAGKPFSSSHVSQMLATLSDAGLVYKNRRSRYSFAVPLLGRFILRQASEHT
ncbi:MAG TPA: ATP-binding protein [Armatimonadota bacterium]|nr:ATP-binding protein [Armatimonadota bacterium]